MLVTMSLPALQPRYSAAEYLRMERTALEKHEFDDGEILAMSGASPRHVILAGNCFFQLKLLLKGKPCQPYGSDLRIAPEPGRRFVYPDISIICGPPQFDPADDRNETVTNPVAIVEILSPSTERYDRTRKFDQYRKCPTFREYVLIAQDEPRVETFFRQSDGSWLFNAWQGNDSLLKLLSISVEIPLADIYAGVEFPNPPQAERADSGL